MRKWMGAFLILALVLGCGGMGAEASEKVKVTEAIHGVFFLPLYLAHGLKLFEKEGLDVEIVTTQAGPLAMQALVAGEVQFCATGHGLVANMYTKGKGTWIVHNIQDKCTFYLMGRPEVKSIQDLRGKRVGCTKIGAESYAIARAILKRAGLDPEKDVTLVGVGGMDTTAGALENDQCQAVVGWQPLTDRLVKEGKGKILASLNTESDSQKHLGSPRYSFTIIEVTDEYLRRHPDSVQKFVNALVAAKKWIATHSIDEIVEASRPYFAGMELDHLKASIEGDKTAFSEKGFVSKEAHDSVIQVWMEAGLIEKAVPMEAIVDNSFTEKAWK